MLDPLVANDDAEPPPKPKTARQRLIERVNAGRNEPTTVLVLRGASPSLTEADFRRMIPKGKHIEEWAGEGSILKGVSPPPSSKIYPNLHVYADATQ